MKKTNYEFGKGQKKVVNGTTCNWILTVSGKKITVAGTHDQRVQFFKKWGYDNKWSEYMAFMSEHTDNLVTAR